MPRLVQTDAAAPGIAKAYCKARVRKADYPAARGLKQARSFAAREIRHMVLLQGAIAQD